MQIAPPAMNHRSVAASEVYTGMETVWYGDGAGNTVEENSGVFSLIQMH